MGSRRVQPNHRQNVVKSGWKSGHVVLGVSCGEFHCSGVTYRPASKKVSASALALVRVGCHCGVVRLWLRAMVTACFRHFVISCCNTGSLVHSLGDSSQCEVLSDVVCLW